MKLEKFSPFVLLVLFVLTLSFYYKSAIQKIGLGQMKEENIFSAAKTGNLETLNRLLEANINPDTRDDKGGTALFYAVGNNQIDAAKLLIKKGASLKIKDDNGMTALHWAVRNGDESGILVKLLSSEGAYIEERDKNGNTPLLSTMETGGTVGNLTSLLPFKPDLNSQNNFGDNALARACANGDIDSTILLLKNGANPNLQRSDGITPLIIAVSGGHLTIVKELLGKKADPKIKDKNKSNAFDALLLCRESERVKIRDLLNKLHIGANQ